MAKQKKAAAGNLRTGSTVFQALDKWAEKKDRAIYVTLIIACVFLSLISFNARISEAHDDALYLEGGWSFVHEFPRYFYTQNAPLYPMFLALLIKVAGFKLILFKLFSVVFNLSGFILFYKALKGRLPAVVFLPVALFHACNHLIIYYASMTFTEAFYFFLQSLFFYAAVKITDLVTANNYSLLKHWKSWALLGLSMFLVSTAKSSAIVVVPAILLFFILYRNWFALMYTMVAYLAFKFPYEVIVKLVWNAKNQFSSQSRILMQKDPYDISQGNENLQGFINRFFDNCELAFSKRFYQLLGIKSEDNTDTYFLLTYFTILLAIVGFIFLFKQKKKEMVLLALFTGAQLALSFVILQTRWDQPRITLVGMPVLLILILYLFYIVSNRPGIISGVYLSVAVILSGSVVLSSLKRGLKNIPIVQKNLKGDKYYGYTPDWTNFLKCSEWCADNLPEGSLVLSRKAPMSFVYGKGKKFFPVYSVIFRDTATGQSNPDSALAFLKRNKVTHVLVGKLRMNPSDPSAGYINTIDNILAPIYRKWEGTPTPKLKLVHTEGISEECYVYKLEY